MQRGRCVNTWLGIIVIGLVLGLVSPHPDGWAASQKPLKARAGFLTHRRLPAPSRPDTAPNYATVAAELAEQITAGTVPAEIIVATATALAQGGLATADLDVTYMPAVAPQASARVDPRSAISLALDSHQRATAGRVTADELGRMLLQIAGLPADGSAPGELVMGFLSAWISGAHEEPEDPQSFAPLFIAEMAQRQDPPIDLWHPSPEDAARLRLSALDLELLAAAFDRAVVDETSPLSQRATDMPTTPCTEFQTFYGRLGAQLVAQGAEWAGGKGIDAGLQKIGISPTTAQEINTSLKVVGIAAKIWKLLLIYKSGEVTLHIEGGNTVHKRILGEPRQLKKIVARAGISDQDWQEYVNTYKRAIDDAKIVRVTRDCLSSFGMPTPANLSDIAQAVENWQVGWRITGDGEHAFISRDVNPFSGLNAPYRMQLTRSGAYSAEAALQLDITQESRPDHTCGQLKTAEVWVKASLYTAEVPGLDVLVNAAQGGLGLVSSIADLGAGFIQTMWPPTSAIPLTVEYHTLNDAAASSRGETSGAMVSDDVCAPESWTGTSSCSAQTPALSSSTTINAQVTFEFDSGTPGAHVVLRPKGTVTAVINSPSVVAVSPSTAQIGKADCMLVIDYITKRVASTGCATYWEATLTLTDGKTLRVPGAGGPWAAYFDIELTGDTIAHSSSSTDTVSSQSCSTHLTRN